MPIESIKFRPGINVEKPLLANEGGWSTSQLIRFKDGLPQAIGGWTKWVAASVGSLVRCIFSWGDLNGVVRTSVGTDSSHAIIEESSANDVTPTYVMSDCTVNFSTSLASRTVTIVDANFSAAPGRIIELRTPVSVGGLVLQGVYLIASYGAGNFTITAAANASAAVTSGGAVPEFSVTSGALGVTVLLNNHGLAIGDEFTVAIQTNVGGISLYGTYLVQSVVDANNFTIEPQGYATSTTSVYENGGNAHIIYYSGAQGTLSQGEYGVGGYGLGGYGEGGVPGPSGAAPVPAQFWTFDKWGDTLLMCPGKAPIFSWEPNSGQLEAALVENAPTVVGGIFVAMPQFILVAWGASVGGVQQPLLVSWSQAGDYTAWTAAVTNQAGSYTIPSGSRIMSGLQTAQQALIWTDIDVYAMNYIGGNSAELVWGFVKIADQCGLISSRAACKLGQLAFWMSAPPAQASSPQPSGGGFYVYEGAVMPLHCTVWDKVFQDLDWANASKIFAAPNTLFHEVAWFYPSLSGGTGECDSYVKYNVLEKTWDYGKLARTAWQDYSAAGNPLAAGTDQYLYQHEVGTSANGAPLGASVGSAGVMIAEGDQMMFVDWLLPEFQWGFQNNAGTNEPVTVTVNSYRFANDASPIQSEAVQFSATGDGFSAVRLRGRHLTFGFSGDGFWRAGNVRYRAARDGRY